MLSHMAEFPSLFIAEWYSTVIIDHSVGLMPQPLLIAETKEQISICSLPFMSTSCRWTQPVLFPWWWWGMWGVWAKNEHQGLWCLHAPGVPGSVGIQCFGFPSRPPMPRLGHHWPASSIPGKTPAMDGISCRHSESLLGSSRLHLNGHTRPYL